MILLLLALPLTAIYKNYQIRKLKYLHTSKLGSEYDIRFLISYFKKNIDSDRKAIKVKLTYITGFEHDSENKKDIDFDKRIKPIMEKYVDNEGALVKKDFSYSPEHVSAFESYIYNSYLKN